MDTYRTSIPERLNLGSGKDFRPDFFNIDCDQNWLPDAVVDLSSVRDIDNGLELETVRFGSITIQPGHFEQIVANDVLAHVPNLVSMMTACLRLLKNDGVFDISVPYDLSHGAWQDPMHVRTFNERSWLYYTDWFWYLGWSEARFALDTLNFVPSQFGQELMKKGQSLEEIARTPRAIDSMFVRLRKTLLTEGDRQALHRFRKSGARQDQQTPSVKEFSKADARPIGTVSRELRPFANGWKLHQDRHCIWIVSPEGYQHHHAFDEAAELLQEAFSELGGSAPIARHPSEWNGRAPIVFGANLLPAVGSPELPDESILVNLEQVTKESTWMTGAYYALLQRHPVLDYSSRNIKALAEAGITHAQLLEIGYSPSLTRIPTSVNRDIDVLFYGSVNERRAKVLRDLEARGLKVVHLFGAYGAERDEMIARAKVVLNLHYYESAIFEMIRVSYLLANQVTVLSEGDVADPDVRRLIGGLELVPYDFIVDRCVGLVNDGARRMELAQRGFEAIRAGRQSRLMQQSFFPELL